MVCSIGVFHLKQQRLLPEFLQLSKAIYKQALGSPGNISSILDNEGTKVFYAFTHWESVQQMNVFVQSDFHGAILKETKRLCTQVSFLHFDTDLMVDLHIAKTELKNNPNTRTINY